MGDAFGGKGEKTLPVDARGFCLGSAPAQLLGQPGWGGGPGTVASGFPNIVFVPCSYRALFSFFLFFFSFFFNSGTVSSQTLTRASVTGGPGGSSDGPFGGLQGGLRLLGLMY